MSQANITGNYLVCGNEVFVEGQSIGQFQSFEMEDTRENIAGTATVSMPFYTIAAKAAKSVAPGGSIAIQRVGQNTTTYVRINPDDWHIRTGARIQVYTWYHDSQSLGQQFERRLEFDGFVREVVGGFPTIIKCMDAAFILKFGTVTQSWPTATPLAALLQQMCDISNDAFAEYRSRNGLTAPYPNLIPDPDSMESEFVLKPATGVSPYDVLERVIVGMYKLYGNVFVEGETARVYCGLGLPDTQVATVELDTSVNVVARNIIPSDMMFENFRVIVRFLEGGEMKTIEKGAENGIVYDLPFTPSRSAAQMEQTALSVLAGLRAQRNKGTITTLLYPLVRLYDYVNFTDTIFTTLSGGYYVIGRKLTCGNGKGYYQTLTVTNKTFLYLAN